MYLVMGLYLLSGIILLLAALGQGAEERAGVEPHASRSDAPADAGHRYWATDGPLRRVIFSDLDMLMTLEGA